MQLLLGQVCVWAPHLWLLLSSEAACRAATTSGGLCWLTHTSARAGHRVLLLQLPSAWSLEKKQKKARGPGAKRKEEMELMCLQRVTNAARQYTVCFLAGRRG